MAVGQDPPRVAHHEHRPHRLSLPALAPDLHGQIDHQLEGIEGDAGLQLAQVAAGEPIQVLAQIDHAHRVHVLGLEAAVQGDHARPGGEQVVGHGLEEGLGQAVVDRAVGHLQDHGLEPGLLGPHQLRLRVGGHNDLFLAGEVLEAGPVARAVQQQQHRVGLRGLRKPNRQVVKGLEPVGES